MSAPMTPYSAPGIFNARDPWYNDTSPGGYGWTGMVPNDTSLHAATVNQIILQLLIDLAQTSPCASKPFGATIIIPGHGMVPLQDGTYDSNGSAEYTILMPGDGTAAINLTKCNWPIRFLGTGNSKLTAAFDGVHTTPGHFFDIDTSAGDNVGGMVFEDLTIKFPTTITTAADVAGIHTTSATNLRINRCVFEECPIGVWLDNALQCAVSYCTFQWALNFGTAIKCGAGDTHLSGGNYGEAKECHISHCVIAGSSSGGNTTGIVIEGSEHIRVDSTQMHGVYEGIQIIPGPYGNNAVRHTFTDVTVYITPDASGNLGNAVLIKPQVISIPVKIAQIVFTTCFFELDDGTSPSNSSTTAGVVVDASDDIIDTVRFVSCYSARWPGPGLQIIGATGTPANVEILGGMYSGNYFHDTAPNVSCGINIGQCSGVRVVGVSCAGSYSYITISGKSPSPQQNVGIYVGGLASDVIIDSCDVTGNSTYGIEIDGSSAAVTGVYVRNCNASGYSLGYTYAINVTGALANVKTVQITNCAGYNDQGVELHNTMPTTAANFYDYSFTTYFGPVEFYTAPGGGAISLIAVDGYTTHLTQGSFFINPGEYAAITWSYGAGGAMPTFLMIGK